MSNAETMLRNRNLRRKAMGYTDMYSMSDMKWSSIPKVRKPRKKKTIPAPNQQNVKTVPDLYEI